MSELNDADIFISMPPNRTIATTMVIGKAIAVPVELAERLYDLAIEAANAYNDHAEWRNSERDEQEAVADAQALRELIDAAQGNA